MFLAKGAKTGKAAKYAKSRPAARLVGVPIGRAKCPLRGHRGFILLGALREKHCLRCGEPLRPGRCATLITNNIAVVAGAAGSPANMALYEARSLDVLTAGAYRTQLDNPTEWTKRVTSRFTFMRWAICAVIADAGQGVGGFPLYFTSTRFLVRNGNCVPGPSGWSVNLSA